MNHNKKNIPNPDLRTSGDPGLGELAPTETRVFYKLEVEQTSLEHDIGRGVFTCEPIKAGSVIIIGGGQVITDVSKAPKDKDYIGMFDEKYFIAPLDFDLLTPNWLINHSCEPNTKLVGRLVTVAARDIAAGEELTLNYSTIVASDYTWSMHCMCGSPECRKLITNEDWKNKELFYRFFEEWPPSIQRRGIRLFEGHK